MLSVSTSKGLSLDFNDGSPTPNCPKLFEPNINNNPLFAMNPEWSCPHEIYWITIPKDCNLGRG